MELAGVEVSIQLIAPASGALILYDAHLYNERSNKAGFHSTDCPSEWGWSLLNSNLSVVNLRFPFN